MIIDGTYYAASVGAAMAHAEYTAYHTLPRSDESRIGLHDLTRAKEPVSPYIAAAEEFIVVIAATIDITAAGTGSIPTANTPQKPRTSIPLTSPPRQDLSPPASPLLESCK